MRTGSVATSALVHARGTGALDRDAFWREMRDRNLRLMDYPALLEHGEIEHIEISSEGLILLHREGHRWWWDPGELRSPLSVALNDGVYEEAEWRVLGALAARARVILDVGANIGWYAIRFAYLNPGAVIHAFEPIPSTYGALEANVRLNDIAGRVIVHDFGLSDRDATVPFFLPAATGSVAASERRLIDGEAQVTIDVELRRLDQVEIDRTMLDLVKCDIEGGELGFLAGAEETIAATEPVIVLEMLRKWSARFGYHPNDIIELMESRGYICCSIGQAVARVGAIDEATTATNFILIPNSRTAATVEALRTVSSDVRID